MAVTKNKSSSTRSRKPATSTTPKLPPSTLTPTTVTSVNSNAGVRARTNPKPPPVPENQRVMERFLKLTGFERNDIIGHNPKTLTFVSSTGGKYQMNRQGKLIRVISGPEPPLDTAILKE